MFDGDRSLRDRQAGLSDDANGRGSLNRREVLLASTAAAAAAATLTGSPDCRGASRAGSKAVRGVTDNTIVVFSGDNGPEEMEPWRGHPGFFDGSYFTGMEGSLRTPCLVRYPGAVTPGRQSNDVVHITDLYTTLIRWAGAEVPQDRVIDGIDQRRFLEGKQPGSARGGFPYWMGATLYGVKWKNFKVAFYVQRSSLEPAQKLATPYIINLTVDPKERKPVDLPYIHSWTAVHFGKILKDFGASVHREPLIPAGAPLGHKPMAE